MAQGFLFGPEFRTDLFAAYYNVLLHRPADVLGLANLLLANLDAVGARIQLESSLEFFANG